MWWVYALLSALFASLTAIFAKIGIQNVNSNVATGIRTIVILLVAWGIVFFKNEHKTMGGISRYSLIFIILSGVATGLSWLFYFRALQLGEVSKVAPVDKLSVALTIVLSVVFLHEALNWKTALGAALIIAGTFVLIWQ